MKRLIDAYRVLKGTHGVHPKGASWFYVNTFTGTTANGITITPTKAVYR